MSGQMLFELTLSLKPEEMETPISKAKLLDVLAESRPGDYSAVVQAFFEHFDLAAMEKLPIPLFQQNFVKLATLHTVCKSLAQVGFGVNFMEKQVFMSTLCPYVGAEAALTIAQTIDPSEQKADGSISVALLKEWRSATLKEIKQAAQTYTRLAIEKTFFQSDTDGNSFHHYDDDDDAFLIIM